jgi:hypothetical protein
MMPSGYETTQKHVSVSIIAGISRVSFPYLSVQCPMSSVMQSKVKKVEYCSDVGAMPVC